MSTKIPWATETWDIVEGCTKVSSGCKFCYAERLAKRARRDFSKVELQPQRMEQPRHWKRSRDVFVCSRSDPFHREVPSEFLFQAFEVMRQTPQHRYLLLTKRPELAYTTWNWPENAWLGVTGEDQENAARRLTELMQVAQTNQIKHLFFSGEPLLSGLDLTPWCGGWGWDYVQGSRRRVDRPRLDWVIVGGESGGPPERALVERCQEHLTCRIGWPRDRILTCGECGAVNGWRPKPEALERVRSLRDQCVAAGVPFHFKQWPIPPYRPGGRAKLDGLEWKERP